MARPVNAGPRLTKRAREKKREQEKADDALGGATMVQVDGEDATKKVPHWYVELQWFRLLRGQARLNQIARILVELAPTKPFDPRDIYSKHLKEEQKEEAAAAVAASTAGGTEGAEGKGKKGGGGKQKASSKRDQIRAANNAKKQKEAAARDAEKLKTLGSLAGTDIKLKTETGKLMLLLSILKRAVQDNNVVDSLDTLWEIAEVVKEVDAKDAKAAIKPYQDVMKGANELRNDRAHLGGLNLVDFQLTSMSDRLPPLNLHSLTGRFKLDDWQLRVINLVNARKSVLITAPTSSGKTVLSTYVCTSGATVLFVVPSEPLAWQVAAMLRALKVDIAIVVPTLNYVPPKFDVVVGTPHALESTLTKQIGFKFDYAVFDEVHSLNNDDGPALQRLIRAIPTECKILALSATIGNATQLQAWWESIVGEGEIELVVHKSRFINLQRYVWTGPAEVADKQKTKQQKTKTEAEKETEAAAAAAAETADADEDMAILLGDNKAAGTVEGTMQLLHPCSSLTGAYLASSEYASSDIAFTPVDAYSLYKSMDALHSPLCSVEVADLKPKVWFASNAAQRITLMQAKVYEDALKERLVAMAKAEPAMTSLLLASLSPGSSLKAIKKARKAVLAPKDGKDGKDGGAGAGAGAACTKEALAEFDTQLAAVERQRVETELDSSARSTSRASLTDLSFHLHRKELLPAICFQLDSVRCQSMFDGLLRELEERELKAHPEFRKNLERRAKGLEKLREKQAKRGAKGGKGNDEEAAAEAQDFGEGGPGGADAVDVDAPHADFVLTPPGRGMGAVETRDVQDKLRDDLPSTGDMAHPLIRGLRRGVGMYIEGLPSAYHRLVQSFAQKGRLGVVFSDELLAYGVNMPFRSCVFFGDSGEGWLTPLLHQQMAGRAGRRGLDRQGHLVYAGFSPERLKSLLRGRLPDVVGKFPLYPTVPLQLAMSDRYEVGATGKLDLARMHQICSTPLGEFLRGETVDGYYEQAEAWVRQLGILDHPTSTYSYLIPELVWELRQFLPESLALQYLLEPIIKKFRDTVYNQYDKDADVNQQTEMFLIFCRFCAREPLRGDGGAGGVSELAAELAAAEIDDVKVALGGDDKDKAKDGDAAAGAAGTAATADDEEDAEKALKWIRALPFPHSRTVEWDEWTDLLNQSQQRIIDADLPYKESMLLPVALDQPLDNMCYASFVRNQIDPSLPTPVQHHLRQRIWNVGEVLRITSNVLGRSAELQPIQNLVRKSFVRIRYVLSETSERNWKKLEK